MTNLAILGLLNSKRSKVSGEILLHGKDLLKASPRELRDVRGKDVAMIFQDPFACLHPMYRVGDQIAEAVRAHVERLEVEGVRARGRGARRRRHPERPRPRHATTRTSSRAACASAR